MLSRLSIRAKLTAAFAAAMLVVLVAAAVFVYTQVRGDLNETLDENLQSRADDVAAVATTGGQGPLRLGTQRLVEGEDAFAQILRTSGGAAGTVTPDDLRILASTLPKDVGPVLTGGEAERAALKPVFLEERKVPRVTGEARILARPVTASDRVVIVVVGATTADREETLSGLRHTFLIGAPIALLLASALGYLLAGRALAPVEAMRRRAGEITLDRSGERLPLPRADDEIHHLGQTLNTMLDRIEASLERERVFVADASHELRTPLANLRTELELANRHGRSEAEMQAALRSAADETERLSQLAEDLLVIARSDQGRLPIKTERTDIATLLQQVRERFERRSQEAGRSVAIEAPAGLQADVDPLRIEQALGNLLDNALRHGGGEVRLRGSLNGDRLELEVADHGSGFPAAFESQAFERFSRADEGRTAGGSGLGLAIARAIAVAHGGDAEIVGANGGQTVVRITLPV
jgi:heavy metal sensor kinase